MHACTKLICFITCWMVSKAGGQKLSFYDRQDHKAEQFLVTKHEIYSGSDLKILTENLISISYSMSATAHSYSPLWIAYLYSPVDDHRFLSYIDNNFIYLFIFNSYMIGKIGNKPIPCYLFYFFLLFFPVFCYFTWLPALVKKSSFY